MEEEKRQALKTNTNLNAIKRSEMRGEDEIEIVINQSEEMDKIKKKENFQYLYAYHENQRKKFIEIKEHDLQTLGEDRLVNDTIINFFLK